MEVWREGLEPGFHLLEPQAWREHEMLGVGATAQFKSSECQADFPFVSVPLPGSFWGLSTNPKRRTDSFCALGHFILHSSFLKEKKIQLCHNSGRLEGCKTRPWASRFCYMGEPETWLWA